jgi:hypothetical protein
MRIASVFRHGAALALTAALLASLPVAAAPATHASGAVGLLPWHQFDLDTGKRWKCTPSPACGEDYDPPQLGGSDLRVYLDVGGPVLVTIPESGTKAKIVRMGKTRPSYAACRDAQQITLGYAVDKAGVWYCARTNSGRFARLKYLGTGTGVGGPRSYDFRWKTWAK